MLTFADRGRGSKMAMLMSYLHADMEIMVQPSSLAARNYLSLQKLFGKSPEVCQIYL